MILDNQEAENSVRDSDEIQEKLTLAKTLLRTHLAKQKIRTIESYLDCGGMYSPRLGYYNGMGANPTYNPDTYIDRAKTIRFLQQLHLVQNLSQELAETNPNAVATIQALKRHIVGSGSTFTIVSDDEDVEPPPVIAKKLKYLIRNFNKCNKWAEIEKEMIFRLHVHGEFFLELSPDDSTLEDAPYVDETIVGFIEPQMIQPPMGENWDGPWSWGILNDRNQRPVAYNVHDFIGGTDRVVPTAFVIHYKINSVRNVKRGIPTFYCCGDDLRGVARLRQANREGDIIRQLIAYIRIYDENTSARSINALADAEESDFKLSPVGCPTQNLSPFSVQAPSVITTNAKSIVGPPANPNEAGVGASIDQGLQAVAAAFGVPEWVPSGKSDVGSYAASLQTGSPFLLTIDEGQAILAEVTCETYKRVAEIAIEQGLLSENTLDECDFDVVYPDNVVRNKKEENDILLDLWDRNMMDTATVLAKNGLDPEQIMAKLLEEPAKPVVSVPAKPTLSSTPSASYSREK